MSSSSGTERGAAAVEFALLVPVLLWIITAFVEFGVQYQQNIQATNAAMQGARFMAVHNNLSGAQTSAKSAAGTNGAVVVAVPAGATCNTSGQTITINVTIHRDRLVPGVVPFLDPYDAVGKGQVQCE